MGETHDGQGELTSLAGLVLDTIARLQDMTGDKAADPMLRNLSVREIALSLPYDPGPDATPLPLPSRPGESFVISLPLARPFLLPRDRQVVLDRAQLIRAPAQRITRLNLTIRLLER